MSGLSCSFPIYKKLEPSRLTGILQSLEYGNFFWSLVLFEFTGKGFPSGSWAPILISLSSLRNSVLYDFCPNCLNCRLEVISNQLSIKTAHAEAYTRRIAIAEGVKWDWKCRCKTRWADILILLGNPKSVTTPMALTQKSYAYQLAFRVIRNSIYISKLLTQINCYAAQLNWCHKIPNTNTKPSIARYRDDQHN